jgi:YEATS domain-containing protein 4
MTSKAILTKKIIVGNTSHPLPKTRDDGHTHQWCVYLKSYENEDLSMFIKKIQFKLHNSYGIPVRTITKPPYEVKETGWGEFDVEIKIFISDASNKTVTVSHPLKLFQQRSEWYDELIFVNPNSVLHGLLTNTRTLRQTGGSGHSAASHSDFKKIEQDTLKSIQSAQAKVIELIEEESGVLEKKRNQIRILKEHIAKAQST